MQIIYAENPLKFHTRDADTSFATRSSPFELKTWVSLASRCFCDSDYITCHFSKKEAY